MNKIIIFAFTLLANFAFAQNRIANSNAANDVGPKHEILAKSFADAYTMYPNLPKGLLEAMAAAASHTTNLTPVAEMEHHHGPERFGLFALVEDGEGYFANTLLDVCAFSQVSPAAFKADPNLQIRTVAAYLNNFTGGDVYALRTAKPLAMLLCEIPATNLQNEYARDLYAYEIYTKIKSDIIPKIPYPVFSQNDWFSPENFAVLSAKSVLIEKGEITANNGSKYSAQRLTNPANPVSTTQNNANQRGGTGNNSVLTTDYAPALWVASPNFSSRGTTAISAVAIHTTEGSYAGAISWFQNTASQVSAHYTIRSSDGQVTQSVLESNKAWHIGNENPYTIGIEHEGYIAQTGWYTTAMYNSSADLVRDICASGYGILPTSCYNGAACTGSSSTCLLPTTYRIKGHQHFPNQTHTDPGINWNWALYYNLINPCAAPTTLSVAAISTTSMKLNWAASGASSYTVQYRANGTTAWTTAAVTTNTLTLTGLTSGTTYNWQVLANCTGSSSAYVAGSNFTTPVPPCSAPTGLASSGISTNGATLTWTAATGAASYSLQYKTATATTWTTLTATSNGSILTGLAASTTYNWQVATTCSGAASSYVVGGNFTTLAPPCGTPTTLATSAITATGATLSWAAATGAVSYSVQYKTAAATTWTTLTATSNSLAISGLTASTIYNWQVATTCATNTSAYIVGSSFTTLTPTCSAPTALAASNLNTSTATLSFTGATGASNYTIEYKTAAATAYTIVTQTATSLNLTGLAASTTYNWRVKTNCTNGGVSAYIAGANFTTQATCYDANEANNTSGTATALTTGAAKFGKICSGDFDWYKVTTTATQTISVTLSQLPANYNLDLYVNGAFVTASATAGTANETITRTAQPAGIYYFRVYPATATDLNTLLDYKILATVTANALDMPFINNNESETATETVFFDKLQVAPNPIENVLNIRYNLKQATPINISVADILGRRIFEIQKNAENTGLQSFEINANDWLAGVYFVTMSSGNEQKTVKVIKK